MKLEQIKIFTFALLGSSIVSVFLALSNLPFPTELTLYCVTIISLVILNLRSGRYVFFFNVNKIFLVGIFFFITVLFYFYISPSIIYSREKVILFFYLIVFKIFVLSLFSYKEIYKKKCKLFSHLKNFSVYALLIFFMLFIFGFTESLGERKFLVGLNNPIWFSRIVTEFIFLILFYVFYTRRFNPIYLLVVAGGIFILVYSGSRGPVLSLIITTIFCFLKFNSNYRKVSLIFSIFFLPLLIFFVLPLIYNYNTFSILQRLDSYTFSLELFLKNPWGYGVGSFGILYQGVDERSYPHNIFLELLVELGFIGVLFYLILIGYSIKTYAKDNVFFYLFIMSFINSQFSGDLVGNSLICVYMFLSTTYYIYIRKNDASLFVRNGKYK